MPRTITERNELMRWFEARYQDIPLQPPAGHEEQVFKDRDDLFRDFLLSFPRLKSLYNHLRSLHEDLLRSGKTLKKKNVLGKKSANYKKSVKEARRIVQQAMNEFEVRPGFDMSEYKGMKRLAHRYFTDVEIAINDLFE